ncbi:MAG: hypothetical protein ACAH89_13260 [Rariglobus sp.]
MHFPRSTPHTSPPRSSGPCFRTDAEGNIPLSRDWLGLLSRARRFDRVVLQTRNTCVRLVTLAPLPSLTWFSALDCARNDQGDLTLGLSHWGQARARLAHCSCCGSPGKIQIFDTTGRECLQLCAHPDIDPSDWAGFLAPLAAPLNATVHPVSPGLFYTGRIFTAHPGATEHDTSLLSVLLELFARAEASLDCDLHTPAATQRRRLSPRRITCEHGLLTVADGVHTLQVILPAIARLVVHPRHIHLVGPDGASLLSLHPADTPDGTCLWSAILHAALNRI